jgi:hypothetical protein
MLKEAVASKAAKLLMTCVCPVAGTTALTLGVPQVRDAVHKAAQPRQYAKPKTRVRATPEASEQIQLAQAPDTPCPTLAPMAMNDLPETMPAISVAGGVDQLADGPQFSDQLSGSARLAEVDQPSSGVPLTSRIFVARTDEISSSTPADDPNRTNWVNLILGFAVIGAPRVTYRKNGTGTKPEA